MPNFAAYILCAVKMSWYSEFSFFCLESTIRKQLDPNGHSTPNQYWFEVDITSICRRPNFDEFPRTLFDVISLIEKSTSFLRTFLDLISMVEKSKLFPHTFFNVISMVEKTTLFPHTFFDVILMVEKSTLLPRTFLM